MDFDQIIDRKNTGALKWDDPCNEAGKEDVIPLWVADMDFASPPGVVEAIAERAKHPVFGYTNPPRDYYLSLAGWYQSRYGAQVGSGDILISPGVVPSLGIAIRALTGPGAGVLVLSPVYYPFFEMIRDNERTLVTAPLATGADGHFSLDFDALGRAVDGSAASGVRVEALLFCSPHNPGGKVWSHSELDALLAFARSRSISIVSDEIHADILLGAAPFTSLAEESAGSSPAIAVIGAPNKTFNLAGLHLSHFIVKDEQVRAKIKRGIAAAGYSQPNIFSLVAARAAYTQGGPWLDELLVYLRGNLDLLESFLGSRLSELKLVRPEGGYLAWIDARALIARKGFSSDLEFASALAKEGRVRLSHGSKFGSEGLGFVRLNFACPRSQLLEGLERLASWAT